MVFEMFHELEILYEQADQLVFFIYVYCIIINTDAWPFEIPPSPSWQGWSH